uniref:Amino acid transporter transmembrane domain-containing protein n=1 Tax=Plectus sambesii TaxID=2011161 RepID=A0A914X697_9BILA
MAGRGRFANSADFLVAVASFAAGPFAFKLPALIYSGGGVYFILAMVLFGILFSIPLTSIEMSLGHISGLAPTATFASISSPLRALGWMQAIACAIFAVHFGQQTAKFLGLTIASLFGSNVLTGCDNDWNIEACKPVLRWYTCLKSGEVLGSVSVAPENCIQQELYSSPEVEFNLINYTDRSPIVYYAAGQFMENFLPSNESSFALTALTVVVWLLVLAGTIIGPKLIGKLLYGLLFLPLFLLVLTYMGISFIDVFESPFASYQYEDQSLHHFFHPNLTHFPSTDGVIHALTYLLAGMGVYHTLASFHRHSETVNQPEKRWKIATIAPWVVFVSMTFTGLIIGLIHFKAVLFLSHVESISLYAHGLMFTDENYLSIPTAFALLNKGTIWTVLFYLALFLLCLGTMIPMFLSVLTSVLDDIHKFGTKKLLTAIVLAIIHMVLSHFSFSDILKFVINLNSKFLEIIILLFLITVGLFYGWHELQKDTMLALGIPKSISGLKQFFTPASQYHTALLLLIGPLFVGTLFYKLFRDSQLTLESANDWFTVHIARFIFGIIMISIALLAIVDCIFLLHRK